MEREIKFRVFEKESKTMFEVGNIDFSNQQIYAVNDYIDYWLDFDEAVLMQYTGMKDKNGKEIYEGDLFRLKDTYYSPFSRDSFKREAIFEVVYVELGYYIKVVKSNTENLGNRIGSLRKDDLLSFEDKEYEIIGNIYQNPELLK